LDWNKLVYKQNKQSTNLRRNGSTPYSITETQASATGYY